jgi:hypothetical protein
MQQHLAEQQAIMGSYGEFAADPAAAALKVGGAAAPSTSAAGSALMREADSHGEGDCELEAPAV